MDEPLLLLHLVVLRAHGAQLDHLLIGLPVVYVNIVNFCIGVAMNWE